MKKMFFLNLLVVSLFISFSNVYAQNEKAWTKVKFSSSDPKIEASFQWAKKMALNYAHDNRDPVGYWYEAALPNREAFCMRDVSHQTIGAEILGLTQHNYNMMTKFMENISESKDWCSYWEIDKRGKPCTADYVDDDDFWYNLNANFDVTFACWRLYEWTGDERYLNHPAFARFYQLSMNEYVERWQLGVDKIMDRPQVMNLKEKANSRFRGSRGLPSYVESFPGIQTSADMIAAIYAGIHAYGEILLAEGKKKEANSYFKQAEAYRSLLDKKWWDKNMQAYHAYWTSSKKFEDGEGLMHLLWFNAVQQPERICGTVSKIMERKDWNIENVSHFALLWYRYGYLKEGYEVLANVPTMRRSEYPEVSYGVLEGIFSGAMGIQPSASKKEIVTCSHLLNEKDYWEVSHLPMLKGEISVRHEGTKCSRLSNQTPNAITWKAVFKGEISNLELNGQKVKAKKGKECMGNPISYVEVFLPQGAFAEVKSL